MKVNIKLQKMIREMASLLIFYLVLLSNHSGYGQLLKELQKATQKVDKTLREVERAQKKVPPRNPNRKPPAGSPAVNSNRRGDLFNNNSPEKIAAVEEREREAIHAENEKKTQRILKDGYRPLVITDQNYEYLYTSWKISVANPQLQHYSTIVFTCRQGKNGEFKLDDTNLSVYSSSDASGIAKGDSVTLWLNGSASNTRFKGRIYQSQSRILVQGVAELRPIVARTPKEYFTINFTLEKAADDTGMLVKGMDEKQYLNRLVNFFGDHHPNVSCNESTIQLKVISRDDQGLPAKIVGTYLFDDSDVKDQVIISFDKGLPYRVSYPDRPNNPDEPANSLGKNGRLSFSAQNNIRIKDLFAVVRSNNDKENEVKRIESLAAVLREQKKYGSFSCKQCLIEEYGVKEYPYFEQVVDPASVNSPDGPEIVDVPKIRYENFIKLTNTCNITIHVVGVKKRLNAKTGMYYVDNTIILRPKEFVMAEKGGSFVVNPDYYYYSKATSAREDIEYTNMAPDEIVYTKIVSTQKIGKK